MTESQNMEPSTIDQRDQHLRELNLRIADAMESDPDNYDRPEIYLMGSRESKRFLTWVLAIVLLIVMFTPLQETAAAQDDEKSANNLSHLINSLSNQELNEVMDVILMSDINFAEMTEEEIEARVDAEIAKRTTEAGSHLSYRIADSEIGPDENPAQVRNSMHRTLQVAFTGEAERPESPPASPEQQVQDYTVLEASQYNVSPEAMSNFIDMPDVNEVYEYGNDIAVYYEVPSNSPSLGILPVSENPSLGFLLANPEWNQHSKIVVVYQEEIGKFSTILKFTDSEITHEGTQVGPDGSTPLSEAPVVLTMHNDIEGLETGLLTVSQEFLAALNEKVTDPRDRDILNQLQEHDVIMIKTDSQTGDLKEIMTNTRGSSGFYVYQFHIREDQPQNNVPGGNVIVVTASPITKEDMYGKRVGESAKREWEGYKIVDFRSPGSEGEELVEGIHRTEVFNDIWISTKVERVFKGGILNNDEDVWYIETTINGENVFIALGKENWQIAVSISKPIAGKTIQLPKDEHAIAVKVEDVVSFLQDNNNLPFVVSYNEEVDIESIEKIKPGGEHYCGAPCDEAVELHEQTDTKDFVLNPNLTPNLVLIGGKFYLPYIVPVQ